jgi:hypothetical protein
MNTAMWEHVLTARQLATIQGFESDRAKSNQGCASQVKVWHVENLRRKYAAGYNCQSHPRDYPRHEAIVLK